MVKVLKKTKVPAKIRAKASALKGVTKAKSKALAICDFNKDIDGLAKQYAALVIKSEKKNWTWSDVKTKGNDRLTSTQRKKVRDLAISKHNVPVIPVNAKKFPAFPAKYVAETVQLDPSLYMSTDAVQFKRLNTDLKKSNPAYDAATQSFPPSKKKYTWHHHQDTGKMQLVEFGVHNATNHKGGRTTWSLGKR
jgi:toxin YxiD